ncbi:MAG TPA: TIGR01459 family HAD-type hydrolase, partial [Hyphomicrobiaceae bacterium]|nr:TIGR01459 family HAD-type hydrolase [Hyphomicrobiaceae bacterium]
MLNPPVIEGARDLLARYDAVFCDVWGVLHDGRDAFKSACSALIAFKAQGGAVVLVSNAPQPKERVGEILDERNVPREAWDAIVSSGDLALEHVAKSGFRRTARIGPLPRSLPFFARLSGEAAPIETAEAIVCTGLVDDHNETAKAYRPMLAKALARRLPFICANPDLIVDVGGRLYLCAGAVAKLYEEMGGEVFWAGKPHLPAYHRARSEAERLLARSIPKSSILAIGDAMRTDIAGAAGFGIDSLFVANGIHRHEVTDNGHID